MNKIIIGNDGIEEQTLDNSVSVNYNKNQDFLSVNSLEINFLDNSEIEIYYKNFEAEKPDKHWVFDKK